MCPTPPSTAKRHARCKRQNKVEGLARVLALTLRPGGAAGPQDVPRLQLIDGAGALGDLHLDRASPRQLLLAYSDPYRRLELTQHALRENVLVDIDLAALPSGTVLRIGTTALVRLMFTCEACARLDLRQPGLARRIGPDRGILARVVRGGVVQPGDSVENLGALLGPWPDDWRERIAQVLDAMPPGHVVDNASLARLAGIQSTYCRAFPRVLARLGPQYAARVVAAKSTSTLPRWSGVGLFDPTPAQRALLASA